VLYDQEVVALFSEAAQFSSQKHDNPWEPNSKAGGALTLWPWSWTFTVYHTIYVQCEYFINQEG